MFRSGRKHLVDPDACPDSSLLFAIDSVIPVIHLHRRHDDVVFTGWGAGGILIFLKVTGAVLVFLVFYVQTGASRKGLSMPVAANPQLRAHLGASMPSVQHAGCIIKLQL